MNPSKPRRRRPQKKKSNRNKFLVIVLLAVVVFVIVAIMTFGGSPTKVKLVTDIGNIVIQLRDDMPITTGNFKNLVQEGVYNGTIFHRVVNSPGNLVMVQGGDPSTSPNWAGEIIPTIKDEFTDNNKNERGTVAMANSGPDSGSSQFFINGEYNSHLDENYPVFGRVIEGMDVVDQILNLETDENDKPLEDVTVIVALIDD